MIQLEKRVWKITRLVFVSKNIVKYFKKVLTKSIYICIIGINIPNFLRRRDNYERKDLSSMRRDAQK